MTLLGDGAITIWNDIQEAGLDICYAWHEVEHMAERVGIPGFIRGRRYIAVDAPTRWFTLYEAVSPETLAGIDYRNRLDSPTPWTKQAVPYFENVLRSITRKVFSVSRGDGGLLAAWALAGSEDARSALRAALAGDILPKLHLGPGLSGAHLLEADVAGSRYESAERKMTGRPPEVPEVVVLLEASRAAALAPAREAVDRAVAKAGLTHVVASGVWQFEFARLKAA